MKKEIGTLAAGCTLALISFAVLASCARANGAAGQDEIGPAVPTLPAPVDEEFEAVKAALIGSWRAETNEPNPDLEGQGGVLWMSIAPITVEGLPDALYVERAWDTSLHHPFGQSIMQLYRFEGAIRIRTLEFRHGLERSDVFSGLWAVPESIPALNADELFATLDFDIIGSDGTFQARTPYPYPTASGGACQLLSEFEVSGDRLRSKDTGIAPDGSVAWSSNEGNGYEWERAEMDIRVRKDDDGFVMIEYAGWDSAPGGEGDVVFLDHVGQTGQGAVFWSATINRTLAKFVLPLSDTPLEGLTRTLADIRVGTIRRTIVPASLGYGEVATPQIPPNSTLYFMIDCVGYEKGEPAPPHEPDAPAEGDDRPPTDPPGRGDPPPPGA